jgi:hypothetical protein
VKPITGKAYVASVISLCDRYLDVQRIAERGAQNITSRTEPFARRMSFRTVIEVRRAVIAATVAAVVLCGCAGSSADPAGSSTSPTPERVTCQEWLRSLVLVVGAPEGQELQPADVRIAGGSSTIKLNPDEFEGRFGVSVFAEEPDIVNVEVDSIPAIDRFGDFVLHGSRVVGDTQQFLLEGSDVWVTMHIVPETEELSATSAREWFGALVDAIGTAAQATCSL